MRTLQVSRATAGFIRKGHPWVRPDRFTKGLEKLRCGESVTLIDERKQRLASALVDPEGTICARVYHQRADKDFQPETSLQRAWEARKTLHQSDDTDCYRIVHGEADYLPGLRIERYANVYVCLVYGLCIVPHIARIAGELQRLAETTFDHSPDNLPRIVIREHIDDIRRSAITSKMFDDSAINPEEVIWGQELGVHIPITPFSDLATGIYVDQRGTREWLHQRCAGKRTLNLFAYTGLFSNSLLHAGAAHATDVDLAQPCLKHATDMAQRNQWADQHRAIAGDCRKVCAQLAEAGEQFDIIISDPPTSAQAGTKGNKNSWIVRRDYPQLLAAIKPLLAPGGLLLACCNTLRQTLQHPTSRGRRHSWFKTG